MGVEMIVGIPIFAALLIAIAIDIRRDAREVRRQREAFARVRGGR